MDTAKRFMRAAALAALVLPLARGWALGQADKCINAMVKDAGKLAATKGKDITACIKSGGGEDCILADSGKVNAGADQVAADYEANCAADPPDFGLPAGGAAEIAAAAVEEEEHLAYRVFGSAETSTDKAGAKCQAAVSKSYEKAAAAYMKGYGSCVKGALKSGGGEEELTACVLDDAKGKAAAALGKLAASIDKACGGLEVADLFPGSCAWVPLEQLGECIGLQLRHYACRMQNRMSGLATDCGLTSADLLDPGPYGVGVTTMTFEDTSRPTEPNGGFPGAATRVLVTEIWYPAAPGANDSGEEQRDAPLATTGTPFPLIVHAHGCTGTRLQFAYLTQHLASHGYVVAAPDFPLSNASSPGGPTCLPVAGQAGDIRFIVTHMLALADASAGRFAGAIDRERIALTGFSLGGLSGYLSTFHHLMRDDRIRTAALFPGSAGCLLSAEFFGAVQVPLLLVHGTADAFSDYETDARYPFSEANSPRYLATLAAATHGGFVAPPATSDLLNNVDEFSCLFQNLPPLDYPGLVEQMGGGSAGVAIHDCRPPCPGGYSRAMRPSRQRQLTILTVLPFLEGYLRSDARAQRFLESTLAEENADVTVEFEP